MNEIHRYEEKIPFEQISATIQIQKITSPVYFVSIKPSHQSKNSSSGKKLLCFCSFFSSRLGKICSSCKKWICFYFFFKFRLAKICFLSSMKKCLGFCSFFSFLLDKLSVFYSRNQEKIDFFTNYSLLLIGVADFITDVISMTEFALNGGILVFWDNSIFYIVVNGFSFQSFVPFLYGKMVVIYRRFYPSIFYSKGQNGEQFRREVH